MEGARVIQVIVTQGTTGAGVEDDPVRTIFKYWSLDGDLLAEVDMMTDGERYRNPNMVHYSGPERRWCSDHP